MLLCKTLAELLTIFRDFSTFFLCFAVLSRHHVLQQALTTGNLDDKTAREIMKMLYEINDNGTTIIMVTHDHSIIDSSGKRVLTLEKGKIVSDSKKGGSDICQQEPTL